MTQSRQGTPEENTDRIVCNGLVRIQPKWFDCTSIETSAWIEEVLGEPSAQYQEWVEEKIIEDGISSYDEPSWVSEHTEHVLEWLKLTTGNDYECSEVDNVYNHEQSFYDVFIYQVFFPKGTSEWYYGDDVYVCLQTHIGGDVRGNYRSAKLYGPHDSLADSGFLEWNIGWYVTYLDGETADDEGKFGIGYHSNPTYALSEALTQYNASNGRTEPCIKWSDKHECFLSRMDGRTVKLFPEVRTGC